MNAMAPVASADHRPVLVTGGAGFIGCNIADRLASQGHHVLIYDALLRPGVAGNLDWLKERHPGRITVVIADMRDEVMVRRAGAEAKAVFHMAAQVAVTTSLADPREDFEINILGTLNLLEALRAGGNATPLIFASTNKVYGDLCDLELSLDGDAYMPRKRSIAEHGIGENRPLQFHTPYGCSKGAADQYVLDYARSFGIPAAVLRMSCIYGQRQLGTEDQGWVAHFLIRALEGKPITLYGDGYQVRDILDVSDTVSAYLAAWARMGEVRGRVFNLGGGPANAVSLHRLLAFIAELLGDELDIRYADWRAGDQRYFVADARTACSALGLESPLGWRTGVARLAEWMAANRPGLRQLGRAQPMLLPVGAAQ
jgi:CDP-paratose 2-epimerase